MHAQPFVDASHKLDFGSKVDQTESVSVGSVPGPGLDIAREVSNALAPARHFEVALAADMANVRDNQVERSAAEAHGEEHRSSDSSGAVAVAHEHREAW